VAQAGVIDSYLLMVAPVVPGAGRSLFEGVSARPSLKLANTRTFQNASVLLTYTP
jgi:hypothetical protein